MMDPENSKRKSLRRCFSQINFWYSLLRITKYDLFDCGHDTNFYFAGTPRVEFKPNCGTVYSEIFSQCRSTLYCKPRKWRKTIYWNFLNELKIVRWRKVEGCSVCTDLNYSTKIALVYNSTKRGSEPWGYTTIVVQLERIIPLYRKLFKFFSAIFC